MREVLASLINILRESSPYLILGFALAGGLHVLLQRFPRITAALTGPGKRPVFLAALLGAPMPLCSCSVMPAALTLRRQGASKGTTASFLVSVPETDIVSILVTLALIGPFIAVYRPLAAIAIALSTGYVIRALDKREHARHLAAASTQSTAEITNSAAMDDCCHAEPTPAVEARASRAFPRPWWARAFHYGFIEVFDDIVPQLFLGIVIAAVIGVILPEVNPRLVQGHKFLSYVIMGAVGIPAYVCAAASTPIAAGLIAGGVSPGAAMVFLLVGPATNLASIVVMRGMFGTRLLAVYLAMIAVASIALGALLDLVIGKTHFNPVPHVHEHGGNSIAATVFMCVFLLWTALSFHRSRLLPRMHHMLMRRTTHLSRR